MSARVVSAALAMSVLLVGRPWALAQEAEPPAKAAKAPSYLRIKRNLDQQPVSLQTSVVRFVPASGEGELVVDLIAAVHMADQRYFLHLNDRFENYDVLLYELVAPPGTRIPKGGRPADNPLAMIQQMATVALDLASQVDEIDYTAANFVHADMSPDEMAEAVRKRGDDGLTLFLSVTADLLRQQNLQEMKRQQRLKDLSVTVEPAPGREDASGEDENAAPGEELDLFSQLLDPDGPVKMKRILAEQFEQMETGTGLGPTLNTILVEDRNQAAIRVFQKQLAEGKKRIGIFYGAAHMPDFEQRLVREFGLKRQSEEWLTAWDLRAGKSGMERLFKLLEPLAR
jgi:hypothetical protein